MAVFKRLTDLLKANAHDLVDRLESPESLLRQTARDLEENFATVRASAATVLTHEKLLTKQLAEFDREISAWRQRAEAAIQRGDDTAARHAISQRLNCEQCRRAVSTDHTDVWAAAKNSDSTSNCCACKSRMPDDNRSC